MVYRNKVPQLQGACICEHVPGCNGTCLSAWVEIRKCKRQEDLHRQRQTWHIWGRGAHEGEGQGEAA